MLALDSTARPETRCRATGAERTTRRVADRYPGSMNTSQVVDVELDREAELRVSYEDGLIANNRSIRSPEMRSRPTMPNCTATGGSPSAGRTVMTRGSTHGNICGAGGTPTSTEYSSDRCRCLLHLLRSLPTARWSAIGTPNARPDGDAPGAASRLAPTAWFRSLSVATAWIAPRPHDPPFRLERSSGAHANRRW
jgi:hypothetical protein